MSTIDETLKERGSRYGEFDEHARVTQDIKAAMAGGRNWPVLDNDMTEALEMVAHKIGRILNGDPEYIDSWTDIIGYTRLVEKRLIAEQAAVKGLLAEAQETNRVDLAGLFGKFTTRHVEVAGLHEELHRALTELEKAGLIERVA